MRSGSSSNTISSFGNASYFSDDMDVDPVAPSVSQDAIKAHLKKWLNLHTASFYYGLPRALGMATNADISGSHVMFVELAYEPSAEYDAARFYVWSAYPMHMQNFPEATVRYNRAMKGGDTDVGMAVLYCEGAMMTVAYSMTGRIKMRPIDDKSRFNWEEMFKNFVNQGVRLRS